MNQLAFTKLAVKVAELSGKMRGNGVSVLNTIFLILYDHFILYTVIIYNILYVLRLHANFFSTPRNPHLQIIMRLFCYSVDWLISLRVKI